MLQTKIDSLLCVSITGLLIEDQTAGLQVEGILQFFRRGLVGIENTPGIGFQINLDLALGSHISGLLVVFEVGTIDPVIPAGVASIYGDGNIVKFSASALLELHSFAGFDFEDGAPLLRLGDSKAFGALLDFEADSLWNLLQGILHAMAGVEIDSGHKKHSGNRGASEPAAQTGDHSRHLKTVYFRSLSQKSANPST